MNTPLTPEEIVNAYRVGDQDVPRIATLSDGTYVIVWQSNGQDGDGPGITAQRFSAQGERIGVEFVVNTTQIGAQMSPSVAATTDGGFVIVWTGNDVSGTGIFAQRFDSLAQPAGVEFQVNTASTFSTQNDPQVVGLPGGGFVIAWHTDYVGNSFFQDVVAQVFDASGAAVGTEFTVNTTGSGSSSNQDFPAIAALQPAGAPGMPGGGFVVVFDDGSNDIRAQRFDQTGTAVGAEFVVNTSVPSATSASVTGLSGGRFVVVWQGTDASSQGVFAQVFEGNGTPVGAEFQVNQYTFSTQFEAAVTATTDGGFVVTWASWQQDGSNYAVVARRYDDAGVAQANESVVNTGTSGNQNLPAVAPLANGNVVVAWGTDAPNAATGDGDGRGIAQRLIGDPATFSAPSARPEVAAVSTVRTMLESDLNAAPQRIDLDGAAAVSDVDSLDFDGGRLIVSILGQSVAEDEFLAEDSTEQDQLGLDTAGPVSVSGTNVSVGGTVIGTITSDGADGAALIITLNANADAQAVEILVENLTYQNVSDDPRAQTLLSIQLEDGDGATSIPTVVTIDITAEQDGDGFIRGEARVNTVTANAQSDSAIATLADGGYVSVWTSTNQDNPGDSDRGVFAQRFDANGLRVGAEVAINTTLTSSQFDADVAGLADGGWVVVWDDDTITGIRLSRYDATGARIVDEEQVETNSSASQFAPQVAALSNGGYAVTWTSQTSGTAGDGSSNGIFVQTFNAAGNRVGGETAVNTQTIGSQTPSRIEALGAGRFVVVWDETDVANGDGSSSSVAARIFQADGTPDGGQFTVNITAANAQSLVDVAALASGDFVAVWRSEAQDGSSGGVYYRRFDDAGTALTGEVRVNDTTAGDQTEPRITALDTGEFVIAWVDTSTPVPGSGRDVFAQVFGADGTRIDTEIRINTEVSGSQDEIALTGLPGGNYVVQWTSQASGTAGDGSGTGVFQQIVGDPAEINASSAPELRGLPGSFTLTESEANAGAGIFAGAALRVLDADSPDFDGGQILLSRIVSDPDADDYDAPDDGTQDNLTVQPGGTVTVAGAQVLVGGVAVANIVSNGAAAADLVFDLLPGATLARVEALLAAVVYRNASDDPSVSRTYSVTLRDGDGGVSANQSFDIVVMPEADLSGLAKAGPETQVNAFSAGDQDGARIAVLNDGGWVTVWRSDGQDGSGDGIFAQRFDADGNRVGGEVAVATTLVNSQTDPDVAGLGTGGWVVVWNGNGAGDTNGVFQQRFDVAGQPAGGETLVNARANTVAESQAKVAAFGSGHVVVYTVGSSVDGSGNGVFLQRYDASGSPLGGETLVNANTSSTQQFADIAVLSDGRLVVAWESATGDGSGNGVFAAIFNPNGTVSVSEFAVNTVTLSGQSRPAVGATVDGGFVIAWDDDSGQDGSGRGIAAQRFDSTATAVGGEFVVNEGRSSTQELPDVIGLDDGRFVITWSDASGRDGSGWGVFGQAFDANGARIDGEFQINTEFSSTQYDANGAALPGGAFVTAWYSVTSGTAGDGSGNGVFQQVFGDPAAFSADIAPVIEGLSDSAAFDESDVNAAFQRIDADATVALGDLDSATFAGGRLTLSVDRTFDLLAQIADPDGSGQDQLGLVTGDVGNGDVQFSGLAVGSTVSVGGTVIGTIASDGANGAPFAIDFNTNATVEAVEALLGNLAYANVSDAPVSARRLKLDLSDDTGNAAVSQYVDVTVTPEADSTLSGGSERIVNAHTDNLQGGARIVELTGGGHVVVWTSTNQDNRGGDGNNGIFGQIYDAAGVPVGREFRANTTFANEQGDVDIAATSDGGFVAVWAARNQDNPPDNDFGVIAQRFNADGSLNGGEIVVNLSLPQSQFAPSVAAFGNGGFVVTYTSDTGDASSDAILSRSFDANGVGAATETLVNVANQSGNQSDSAVAALVDGSGNPAGHVVVFTAPTSGGQGDGDSNGVFARVFDAGGAAIANDFQVNTTTLNSQDDASVTGLSGGGFVVVWTDSAADGSSQGIFGQIYTNAGAQVGGEFRVNTETFSTQNQPDVIAMADGGFVVGWSGQDVSSQGIFAQRFDAAGARVDGELQINTETSSTQQFPALTALGTGFAAVWDAFTSSTSGDGSNYAIAMREFRDAAPADTSPNLTDFARTVTLFANDLTSGGQILDDAVAFDDPDGGDFNGGTFELYFTTPSAATDQLGFAAGAVSVVGTQVSVGGTVVGAIDATETGANGAALRVALNANADAAAVKALIENATFGSTDTAANVTGLQRGIGIVVTDGAGGQTEPDAILVTVTAGSAPAAGLSGSDFGLSENEQVRTVAPASEAALQTTPRVLDPDVDLDDLAGATWNGGFVRLSEVFSGAATRVLSVQDQGTGPGQIGFDGTTVTYEGTAIGTLSGTLTGQGTNLQIDLNASANATGIEALIEALTFALDGVFNTTSAGFDLRVQNGAAASVDFPRLTLPIERDLVIVDPTSGSEMQVNTFTPGNQASARVTALSDGTYLVTWTSAGQDNPGTASDRGLFAQLYSSSGAAIGTEFQVNDISFGDQIQPRATGLPNGNFVILWTESGVARDGNGQSVYGQIFANDGMALGAAFQVNEEFSSNQNSAQIVALDAGRFMAVWRSEASGTAGDGSSGGIFGRTFDATGAPEAGEFQINSTTSGDQTRPRAVTLDDGDVVVVWEERGGADGNGYGVFAQRIDPAGTLVSFDGASPGAQEMQINTTTAGFQDRPDVAALMPSATLPNGGFVFVWESADSSGDGIFAQIYGIDGAPVGGEFQVSVIGTSNQRDPEVAGRPDGTFTVIWSDDSGIDGSGTGVVAQNVGADGALIGNPFLVNSEFSSTQHQPGIATLNNGTLVATWTSVTSGSAGDGSGDGVFQTLIDAPAPPAGAMNPVLVGIETAARFDETAVNAGMQLLDRDGAVSLTDPDSADFAGGALTVSRLVGTRDAFSAQLGGGSSALSEAIGIVPGGGVSVNGANVLVGGLPVGQIDPGNNGMDGADFIVTFNANATPERVEAVIARLGYANASDDPASVQSLAINVTDGDGGSTGNAEIAISVTPETDRTALPAGGEEQVNTYVPGGQSDAASAPIYDGVGGQVGYVTVWQSADQDRVQDGGTGIFGQVFDLNGVPVGAEFLVTAHTEFNQSDPTVAGLTGGGFVVGWSDNSWAVPDGIANGETSTGVFARVFDAAGVPLGADFLINDIVSSTQREPEFATRANGNFLAVYTDDGGADGSGAGVFLREFQPDGTPVAASVQVNTEFSSTQSDAAVTELAGGRVVVTWTSQASGTAGDGNSNGVFAQMFNANLTPFGSEFQVNAFSTNAQDQARVAALANGDFVIVWDSDGQDGSAAGVYQQRYDALGTAIGAEGRVNATTVNSQFDPHVVALDTGGWVVAWSDNNSTDGSGVGVFGQEYDAAGNRVDGEFQINTEFSSTQSEARLVALPGGGFVASWTSITSATAGDGNGNGVFQQVFAAPGTVDVSPDPVLIGLADIATTEVEVNGGGVRIAPAVGLSDDMGGDLSGAVLTVAMLRNDTGQPQFAAPDDLSQDQLSLGAFGGVTVTGGNVRVNGTIVGTLDSDGADGAPLVVSFGANADAVSVRAVIEAVIYANPSNDPEALRQISVQLTDGDGGFVRDTIALSITPEVDGGVPVRGEVQTNSFIAGEQTDSHVATLADGGYVIVWTSNNQDATGDGQNGVFAQRYDAAGAPVGGEIQVNTTTASGQQNAQVLGLATGGFVVAWEDFSGQTGDDADQEVVFQVYDAAGARVGGEVAVDSPVNFDPDAPALAGFGDGSFVFVHHGRDLTSPFLDRVHVQRFDDQGGTLGTETVIATPASSGSRDADVAVQNDGSFVVAFTQVNVDRPGDSDTGVFLQRFDAAGSAVGGPVLVNDETRFSQFAPRVAATEDGGYVVVFESDIRDDFGFTSQSGIYAQRFDASGNEVGSEFLVNRVVDGTQSQPDVAATVGGGFAVTYSDSNGTDGSGTGVFLQQYDAQGARIDGPVQVNEETSSTQNQAAIAALPGGNFVVSFASQTSATAGDGSGNGIFHRLIGDPDDFGSGGDPVLDGVNTAVTYAENTLNGVPQLIDVNGAVAVSDPDSADFDGGSILVSSVIASAPLIDQINPPDDLTQDQYGLRQTARITINGSDVSIDGNLVGTIAQDGQNGSPFEVSLNANATPELVELLVENLTYRNISDDPLPVRLLRIQITDGDGGASDPVIVTVNITPTPDAAVAVGGERQVNTTDTNNEDNPAVAQLPGTGGDYVIVFESFGTDGSREGILGQRFDVNGNPVARDGTGLPSGQTDEFPVNTTSTLNDQFDPQIAAFSDGSWVVVWTDDSIDGNSQGIAAQLFNADGSLNGTEFQVNQQVSSQQYQPSVTVLDDDTFVVSWTAFTSAGSGDGSSYGIAARQFDASGNPVGDPVTNPTGSEYIVNTTTTNAQQFSSVTGLNDGGFLVTWEDQGGADGSADGIYAQRFDATGNAVGSEFRVNTTTANSQFDPDVTVLTNGNIVVVWTDSAADLSGQGVFAQIYDVTGAPVNDEFRVNDQRISTQNDPAIAALDTGGFVIVWVDHNGTDGSGQGVFAQQYDAAGNRLDSQFQVNTTFSSTQNQPDVAGLPGGGFVVTWYDANGAVMSQVYGNDAPVVSPIAATGDEDTAIVLDVAIFDAGFSDPNGNTLQAVRIDTFPTDGTLTLSGTPVVAGQSIARADLIAGNLVYVGNQDFNGGDSFDWTGSDGIAFAPSPALATITVNPVNDAPGLAAGADTTLGEGQALNRQLVLTDPDTDNRTFTVDYGDGSAVQSFTTSNLMPNLNYSFGAEGSYTVTVTVDDNSGAANAAETDSFVVTVVNAAPNAANDVNTVSEDGPSAMGDVRANDSDPGGDPTTVTEVNGQAANVGQQITLASGALLTLNVDGTYTYDPNGQFEALADFQNASDSFAYTLSDGLLTDTAMVFITIDGQNDAPVAVDDTLAASSTTPATGNVLANDTDVDAPNTLVVAEVNGQAGDVGSQITLGSGALVTLNADGTFDYDPNGAFPAGGSDSFDYTVSDQRGGTDTATVTVNVGSSQLPPVAGLDQVTTDEASSVAGDVLANDTDPNNDALTVTRVNGVIADVGTQITLPSGALLTLNADGTFSYDPNGGFESLGVGETGLETFSYTVEDGFGGSDDGSVEVTINGLNDAPVAASDSDTTDEDTALAVGGNLLANDSDVDANDMLTIDEVGGSTLAVGMPAAGTNGGLFTINADGSYAFDPNGDFEALAQGALTSTSIQYRVTDGNGGTDTALLTVQINGVNDAPDAVDDGFSVGKSGLLSGSSVLTNDTDADTGDVPFVVTVNGQAANVGGQVMLASGALLTVNAGGTFSYDPNGQFDILQAGQSATDSFDYTIEDGSGAQDTATVTITVNGSSGDPVASADSAVTDEDNAVNVAVLGNDTDPDGDTLTVAQIAGQAALVGVPVTLASGALATLNANGTIDYDPNDQFENLASGDSTTDSFSYQVSDGNGGTATATVTVTLNGVNDAPIAQPDARTTDEDSAVSIDLLANNGFGVDSDVDTGAVLEADQIDGQGVAISDVVTLASGATVTKTAAGQVLYDPNGQFESLGVGETASDSFSYRLTDGEGGFDTTSVTVTIQGVNDAPDAVDDSLSIAVGASLMGDVLASNGNGPDTDPDANDTLSVIDVQNGGTLGTPVATDNGGLVTLNADGTFDYDQNGAFAGLGSGQTATDSFVYAVSDGNGGTDTATVTITVGGSNLPPVAVDDTGTTDEAGAITLTVLGNDSDPNGDTPVVTALDVTGTLGAVTLNVDGTVAYDPNGQFESLGVGDTATDSFAYTIGDGNGSFDTATVTVTITGLNDAPVATADAVTLNEDTAVSIAVLANDTDIDAGDVLTISGFTSASNGSLTQTATGFDYTPFADFNGIDSFTYTISDGKGGSDTATVMLTVLPVNDDPVAVADSASTLVSAAVSVSVLGNDTDVDGDTLTVASATDGSNGSTAVNANGTVTYTPNAAFAGVDTFTYVIDDGNGGQASAQVSVTVNTAPNLAPTAGNDAVALDEDTSALGNVLANDSDPDGDTLTVTLLADVTNGVLSLQADGSFTYTPDADYNGIDGFTYEVDDGRGGTDTATVTLTVNPVNDAPVGVDDTAATDEDTTTTIAGVLLNDTDIDGDTLSVVSIDTTGTLGLVSDNGDGTFFYDPNGQFEALAAGQSATDTFIYTVGDGNGGTDTATVTVTIQGRDEGTVQPLKLIGTRADDMLVGDAASDFILLRYGQDSATGNGGADTFTFDGRNVIPGDQHTITDLDFSEGDTVTFRFFDMPRTIASDADLQFYLDNGFATVNSTTGSEKSVTFQDFDQNFGSSAGTFIGTRGDDVFDAGAGNDTVLLRFGNDTVSGGADADTFIFDGRYVGSGSQHVLSDLNFTEGDVMVFRFWEAAPLTRVESATDLAALDAETWATLTTGGLGQILTLTNEQGDSMTVSFA